MTLLVERLEGDEFETIGRVEDGEVTDERLLGIYPKSVWRERDEEAIAGAMNGPRVVASVIEEGVEKASEWKPYRGPRGGEGWQSVSDPDDVVYDDDPPGEVAEEYEEQAEGWGEDDASSTNESTEVDASGVPEGMQLSDTVGYSVSEWEDITQSSLAVISEEAVVDMGDGPEPVYLSSYGETIDYREWGSDDFDGSIDIESDELIGGLEPATDDRGRRTDAREIDLPEFEGRADVSALEISQYREFMHESREAAHEVQQAAFDRLKESYDDVLVDETALTLGSWAMKGYGMIEEIWLPAMAMVGDTENPSQLEDIDRNVKELANEEESRVLFDLMRLSKAEAKREHGDEVTVYRSFKKRTIEDYADVGDDGSVTIEPQVLESWSLTEDRAEDWGVREEEPFVIAEKTFSTDKVGYYGPLALGKTNVTFKEITMNQEPGETYTVDEKNLDFHGWELSEMEKEAMPVRLPVEASDWIPRLDDVEKSRRYVDHASEVPDDREAQQGPQGGIYYETESASSSDSPITEDVSESGEQFSANGRRSELPDPDYGYVSTREGPDLDIGTADEWSDLGAEGASAGASSRHMEVAKWDDGSRAFVTRFGDNMQRDRTGEKPLLGERAIAADRFLRNIGFADETPKHRFDREAGYMAVEGKRGEETWDAPDPWCEKIDEERFKDMAAATMLMGNSDLHRKNIIVTRDGTFHPVDLDKSGGDFREGNRFRRRGVHSILGSARQVGIDMNRDELDRRAQKLAREIDIEEALHGVENSQLSDKGRHQFRENIRSNIEAFREGSVL